VSSAIAVRSTHLAYITPPTFVTTCVTGMCILCCSDAAVPVSVYWNVLPVNLGGWQIIMKWEGLVIKGELLSFERELVESGFGWRRLRPDSNL